MPYPHALSRACGPGRSRWVLSRAQARPSPSTTANFATSPAQQQQGSEQHHHTVSSESSPSVEVLGDVIPKQPPPTTTPSGYPPHDSHLPTGPPPAPSAHPSTSRRPGARLAFPPDRPPLPSQTLASRSINGRGPSSTGRPEMLSAWTPSERAVLGPFLSHTPADADIAPGDGPEAGPQRDAIKFRELLRLSMENPTTRLPLTTRMDAIVTSSALHRTETMADSDRNRWRASQESVVVHDTLSRVVDRLGYYLGTSSLDPPVDHVDARSSTSTSAQAATVGPSPPSKPNAPVKSSWNAPPSTLPPPPATAPSYLFGEPSTSSTPPQPESSRTTRRSKEDRQRGIRPDAEQADQLGRVQPSESSSRQRKSTSPSTPVTPAPPSPLTSAFAPAVSNTPPPIPPPLSTFPSSKRTPSPPSPPSPVATTTAVSTSSFAKAEAVRPSDEVHSTWSPFERAALEAYLETTHPCALSPVAASPSEVSLADFHTRRYRTLKGALNKVDLLLAAATAEEKQALMDALAWEEALAAQDVNEDAVWFENVRESDSTVEQWERLWAIASLNSRLIHLGRKEKRSAADQARAASEDKTGVASRLTACLERLAPRKETMVTQPKAYGAETSFRGKLVRSLKVGGLLLSPQTKRDTMAIVEQLKRATSLDREEWAQWSLSPAGRAALISVRAVKGMVHSDLAKVSSPSSTAQTVDKTAAWSPKAAGDSLTRSSSTHPPEVSKALSPPPALLPPPPPIVPPPRISLPPSVATPPSPTATTTAVSGPSSAEAEAVRPSDDVHSTWLPFERAALEAYVETTHPCAPPPMTASLSEVSLADFDIRRYRTLGAALQRVDRLLAAATAEEKQALTDALAWEEGLVAQDVDEDAAWFESIRGSDSTAEQWNRLRAIASLNHRIMRMSQKETRLAADQARAAGEDKTGVASRLTACLERLAQRNKTLVSQPAAYANEACFRGQLVRSLKVGGLLLSPQTKRDTMAIVEQLKPATSLDREEWAQWSLGPAGVAAFISAKAAESMINRDLAKASSPPSTAKIAEKPVGRWSMAAADSSTRSSSTRLSKTPEALPPTPALRVAPPPISPPPRTSSPPPVATPASSSSPSSSPDPSPSTSKPLREPAILAEPESSTSSSSSDSSPPYPPYDQQTLQHIQTSLQIIRDSRRDFPRAVRSVPIFPTSPVIASSSTTSTSSDQLQLQPIFLPPTSPTYLSDLRLETEALWSYRVRSQGSFLSSDQKDAFLRHLKFTVSLAKRGEGGKRSADKRREYKDMKECVGRDAEERFRVWCAWGRGKEWVEGVRKAREEEEKKRMREEEGEGTEGKGSEVFEAEEPRDSVD